MSETLAVAPSVRSVTNKVDRIETVPIARNQSDTITSGVPVRAESGCSATPYAPQYAPRPTVTNAPNAVETAIFLSWNEIGCIEHTSAKTPSANPTGQRIPSCNPAEITDLGERYVMRSPKELRLHPAFQKHGLVSVVIDLNSPAPPRDESALEPLLITRSGTILKGFERWRLALINDESRVPCSISSVEEEMVVQVMLVEHRPKCGWNDFIRISLALTQEDFLRKKAIQNMSTGGRNKGSTNLSEADRIDVAQEIAHLAGTGIGNVRKVRLILANAHPNLITALQRRHLRIHRAWVWCRKLTRAEQRVEFALYLEKQSERRLLRGIVTPRSDKLLDQSPTMEAVEHLAAWHNSIQVDDCRCNGRIVPRKRYQVVLSNEGSLA